MNTIRRPAVCFAGKETSFLQRCLSCLPLLAAVAAGLMVAVSTRPVSAAAPNVDQLLQKGQLVLAETQLQKHLAQNPRDDNARFGLGAVQFLQGIERLMQSLHKYGLRNHGRIVPFLRLPAPRNIEPEEIRYEDMRRIYEDLQDDLTKAEKTLAGIQSDVKLPLHVGLIRMDFNGDAQAEDRETLWQIYIALTRARNVNEAAAKKFVIHFDRGDVHWLRGYCHLLLAFTDFILAHDWRENFDRTAQLFFQNADTPFAYLRHTKKKDPQAWFDEEQIADVIAFIHLIRFKVQEPQRMKSALGHLQAMIAQSRLCWKFVEAEKDNDHEWIPNARQKGVIPGMQMSAEQIRTWKQFLDEAEAILQGKKLAPHWRVKDGRGINLRRVFTEPRTFDAVLWAQGSAAQPYLEQGEMTDRKFWQRLIRVFRGNFIGFAIWLN